MTTQPEPKIQGGQPEAEELEVIVDSNLWFEAVVDQYHKEMPHLTREQISRELSLVI